MYVKKVKGSAHTCRSDSGEWHVGGRTSSSWGSEGGGAERKLEEVEGGGTPLSGHPLLPADTKAGNGGNKVVAGRPDGIRHLTGGGGGWDLITGVVVPLYGDKPPRGMIRRLNTCPDQRPTRFQILMIMSVNYHHHHFAKYGGCA